MSWGAEALQRRRRDMDALRESQQSGGGSVDTAGIEKTAKELTKAFSEKSEPKTFNNAASPSFVPPAQQKPPIP